eukprot:7608275-Pyramimonas_sp.AAC.1
MVQVVTTQQNAPTSQIEEGLQQIYLSVVEIRRIVGSFEDVAETLDGIHHAVGSMANSITHVEAAVSQLGQMM